MWALLSVALLSLWPSVRPSVRPAWVARVSRATVVAAAADDINQLVTQLNAAIAAEDYSEAARLKKLLDAAAPEAPKAPAWDGAPAWLADRLFDLGFTLPTPVQSASLALLAAARLPTESRARRTYDAVLRASTGSGKTLAYVACAITSAAEQLAARGEASADAVARAMEAAERRGDRLSPTDVLDVLSPKLVVGSDANAPNYRTPTIKVPARGGPLIVIVAPTAELVRQVAGATYEALGGYSRATRSYEPGARDSLFRYAGPKGARVLALLSRRAAIRTSDANARYAEGASTSADLVTTRSQSAEEDEPIPEMDLPPLEATPPDPAGDLGDADVLVCTPGALAQQMTKLQSSMEEGEAAGFLDLSALRAVVIDEADVCCGNSPESDAVRELLRGAPPGTLRILTGASVSLSLVRRCVAEAALTDPTLVNGDGSVIKWGERGMWASGKVAAEIAGSGDEAAALVAAAEKAAEGEATWRALPSSISHKVCVIEDESARQAALTELCFSSLSSGRGRAVVFAKDEDHVLEVAASLRKELWGNYAVMALLPSKGDRPLEVAENFRRDKGGGVRGSFSEVVKSGSSSLLVAPVSSARGLDFRDITFVILLAPPSTAEGYVHQAGRAGRVGQLGRAEAISLLASKTEKGALRAVVEGVLGRDLIEVSEEAILETGKQVREQREKEAGSGEPCSAIAMDSGDADADAAALRLKLESVLDLDSDEVTDV